MTLSDDAIGHVVLGLYFTVVAIYVYLLFGGGLVGSGTLAVYPYPAIVKVPAWGMYIILLGISIPAIRLNTKKWGKVIGIGTLIIAVDLVVGQYQAGTLFNPVNAIASLVGLFVAVVIVMVAFFGD